MDKFEIINNLIKNSNKKINILPIDKSKKDLAINTYDFNEKSSFAAIILNTGGIIIDNWVRLYGTGELDSLEKNKFFNFNGIVVAEDIIGGLFLQNKNGLIWYFSPDTLKWENLNIQYYEFIQWLINGDLEKFYSNCIWNSWQDEIKNIHLDQGVMFYPFLFSKENNHERNHKIVDFNEILDFEKQYYNIDF